MPAVVTPSIATDEFQVIVAPDRLGVSLAPPLGAASADVRTDTILHRLREMGLDIESRVGPMLDALAVDDLVHIEQTLLLAEATPAIDDVPAHFEAIAEPPPSPDVESDQYHRCRIHIVHANQPVARLVPTRAGEGADIFGNTLPFRNNSAPQPQTGENVLLDPATGIVTSTCDGSLLIEPAHVHVENLLHIKSSVDFATGSIEFNGDVMIDGGVADLFEIKARNITIHKAVEAATIVASQFLHIDGGVLGKEKGLCSAGTELAARFISNATVKCGGAVTVLSEINNSDVTCEGKLTLTKGSILKARIGARDGVVVHAIGSNAELNTVIRVGPDDEQIKSMVHTLEQLDHEQVQCAATRQSLETVLHDARMSEAQRGKGRLLLRKAIQQEQQIAGKFADAITQCRQLLQHCNAQIEVTDRIYPGVVLRFPGLETFIQTLIRGPVRIAVREIDHKRQIVAISEVRHLNLPLGTITLPADRLLHRLALAAGGDAAMANDSSHHRK